MRWSAGVAKFRNQISLMFSYKLPSMDRMKKWMSCRSFLSNLSVDSTEFVIPAGPPKKQIPPAPL
jgi:hypothetical protein